MPNAVIAHHPDGVFDREALLAAARAFPGIDGMDLVPEVGATQRYEWDETSWTLDNGYGRRRDAKYRVVAVDYGIKRNILRLLADLGCEVIVVPATASAAGDPGAEAGRRVPLQRPRRSRGDRALRRAGHPGNSGDEDADLRHLSRPSDARPRHRRQDDQDAAGPSRRQPSGEGFHHRQGRDRLDEPRLRGRSARRCPPTRG